METTFFDTTRTYGIELEFLRPKTISQKEIADIVIEHGVKAKAELYNKVAKPYWKVIYDGSVISTIDGYDGKNEIVSPILHGSAGLIQIKLVCKALKKAGCIINQRCGLHVHHGLTKNKHEAIYIAKNAILTYHKYKKTISKIVYPSRLKNNSCLWWTEKELNSLSEPDITIESRDKVINWLSYKKYGTLEFRQHSGTLEAKKIINWIKITQAIITRSLYRDSEFMPTLAEEIDLKKDLISYIRGLK